MDCLEIWWGYTKSSAHIWISVGFAFVKYENLSSETTYNTKDSTRHIILPSANITQRLGAQGFNLRLSGTSFTSSGSNTNTTKKQSWNLNSAHYIIRFWLNYLWVTGQITNWLIILNKSPFSSCWYICDGHVMDNVFVSACVSLSLCVGGWFSISFQMAFKMFIEKNDNLVLVPKGNFFHL